MIAEELGMKLGGGVICRCGQRKDARLLMCNPCMVKAMSGVEEPEAVKALAVKECERPRCKSLTVPGGRFCKGHQACVIKDIRAAHPKTEAERETNTYRPPIYEKGHRGAQDYWRQEMEKYDK